MKKTPEEDKQFEEERFKKEEENLLSKIKDRLDATIKYQEDKEKQL